MELPRGRSRRTAFDRLLATGFTPPPSPEAVAAAAAAVAAARTIDDAKRSLAPRRSLSEWSAPSSAPRVNLEDGAIVVISSSGAKRRRLKDNVPRASLAVFTSHHGDDLPREPTVITGCCDGWSALGWSVDDLASRLVGEDAVVALDGGPGFARLSLGHASVSMREYQRYVAEGGDGDAAPLYVFDADAVKDGGPLRDGWTTPHCFSHDAQAGVTGSRFRPLPPAWLLVGVARSGTPIHNHPSTAAWVPLLSGAKAWIVLPPNVAEEELLLGPPTDKPRRCSSLSLSSGDDDDAAGGSAETTEKGFDLRSSSSSLAGDEAAGSVEAAEEGFDLSALRWFGTCTERTLPPGACVVVQRPGEVVFLPAGWWHVVLNVETSVALSHSLALRRDVDTLLPMLLREDPPFGEHWMHVLGLSAERSEALRQESKSAPRASASASASAAGALAMEEGRPLDAVLQYTACLEACHEAPSDSESESGAVRDDGRRFIHYANRAAAFLAAENFHAAADDARRSIAARPSTPSGRRFIKAHYRLARALVGMKQPSAAIDALADALVSVDGGLYDKSKADAKAKAKLARGVAEMAKLRRALVAGLVHRPITSYAFEDDGRGPKVKVWITDGLDGVGALSADHVTCAFGRSSIDLRIRGLLPFGDGGEDCGEERCVRLFCAELWGEVVPDKCRIMVKANSIKLVLCKAAEGGHSWEKLHRC